MSRHPIPSRPPWPLGLPDDRGRCVTVRFFIRLIASLCIGWSASASAVVLWSDLGTTPVHNTGAGADILGGAVKRDDSSSDTLYFKFQVEPRSDTSTEDYFAAFELFEGDSERLGVGNALKAWAYSSFVNTAESGESNHIAGYIDLDRKSTRLNSSHLGISYAVF